ncbi:MAG: hypothetical protein IPM56_04025 [Ignavibacteriales bacterium]|nr:MAG: hypothetical protein IPM56_04025 [Ignavibacteriales bacterium]
MKDLLKLQVLFTTLIDSNKDEVLCKIPNVELLEDLIKNGLQNSTEGYAIAYINSFPTFDQYDVSFVEWVKIIDIEKKNIDGQDQWNVQVEVLEEFDSGSFDVELGHDEKMDTEVPKYVVFSDGSINKKTGVGTLPNL